MRAFRFLLSTGCCCCAFFRVEVRLVGWGDWRIQENYVFFGELAKEVVV